jgi:hypothetical protein
MDKTLEDELARLPDNLSEYFGGTNPIGTDDDHTCCISMAELRAEKRRAVEMAIRRAAEVCATQKVFTGPKACAAAILKLLD